MIWTWYYETGMCRKNQFIDGQQDGLWTQWFPDGQKNLKEHLAMEKEITNGLLGTEMEIKSLKETQKR